MSQLKKSVTEDTLEQVEVVYLDRLTAKWWNNRRGAGSSEPGAYCGFFWVRRDVEGGPFKTRSAAIRDAYYRFVLRTAVPVTGTFANGGRRQSAPSSAAAFSDWINS